MAVITMKQLLESGVHFGHQTRRWNPKMAKYIYTKRNGIHIIDLQKTVSYIEDAYKSFLEMGKEGKKVLFVGTKKQAQDAVRNEATRAGHFYVTKRWLGGTLTNFKTLRHSIRRLHNIKKWQTDGTFDRLPKKETVELTKELERLEKFLGGIKDMRKLPDAVFITDTRKEYNAVREARKLGIPIFAMVDTNSDPDIIDRIIPANDDAIRSIKLITNRMAEALIEGQGGEETEEAKKEEMTTDKEKQAEAAKKERPQPKKEDVKKAVERTPSSKPSAEKPSKSETGQKAGKEDKPVEPAPSKQSKEVQKEKPAEKDLESLTVPELKEKAKEKGLSGYSKLRKAELIEALKK